jgi:uncharacterized membrane protein
MEHWLRVATEKAALGIEAIALVVVVAGTLEAFVRAIRAGFALPAGEHPGAIWLHYARWLVAGLTFQLAADIIETSVTTSWEAVARLGAIALIRTFLNYFLGRDIEGLREERRPGPGEVAAVPRAAGEPRR